MYIIKYYTSCTVLVQFIGWMYSHIYNLSLPAWLLLIKLNAGDTGMFKIYIQMSDYDVIMKEVLSLTAEPGFSGVAAGRGVKTWPPCREMKRYLKVTHLAYVQGGYGQKLDLDFKTATEVW